MTLSRRIGRMEAAFAFIPPQIEIEASDANEAETLFEDAVLNCVPGPVCVITTVAGVRSVWRGHLHAHEHALMLLNGEGQ